MVFDHRYRWEFRKWCLERTKQHECDTLSAQYIVYNSSTREANSLIDGCKYQVQQWKTILKYLITTFKCMYAFFFFNRQTKQQPAREICHLLSNSANAHKSWNKWKPGARNTTWASHMRGRDASLSCQGGYCQGGYSQEQSQDSNPTLKEDVGVSGGISTTTLNTCLSTVNFLLYIWSFYQPILERDKYDTIIHLAFMKCS